jgi:hypothetical protein
MIKKVKEGYKVLSEKGKNLGGPYKSKAEAEKQRLIQARKAPSPSAPLLAATV